MERISEHDYQARAFPELSALLAAFDAYPDELFAELGGDVITIEFEDRTRYVVNSHLAARQIWLAAERNAWHFDYREEDARWIATKTGDELWQAIDGVVSRKLDRAVGLSR